MVQEQGSGNITVGQSHARMLLDWAVAAGAEQSGNGRIWSGHLRERDAEAGIGLGVRFRICSN